MRFRYPTRPTPLTPAQTARLRTLDIRLLFASGVVYLAIAALTIAPWPAWIIAPIAIAAYTPLAVQFIRFRTTLGLKSTQPLIPAYPRNLLHTGAFMSFAMLAGIAASLLLVPHIPGSILLIIPCIGAALTMLNASNSSFIRSPPACPACGYPLEGLTYPLPCPECGLRIGSKSEAVTSRKLSKPGLRVAGVACMVLPLLAGSFLSVNPGLITTRLPHSARLALAPTDPAAFNTVVPNLTPEQRDRLITRILDASTTDDVWLMDTQLSWLAGELAANRLSPGQSDRFAIGRFRFEITADPIRRVGLPMRIWLTGDALPTNTTPVIFQYFTRGFEINDELSPAPDHPFLTSTLGAIHEIVARSVPLTTHTPETTGPLGVRIRIIAITTTNFASTITWHDDGTYTITPEPLTTHELTAETTLTVAP